MLLNELFQTDEKTYPLVWGTQGSWIQAEFRTDLVINFLPVRNNSNDWILVFQTMSECDGYHETGHGDGFKVYATIVKGIKEFIKAHKPDQIQFQGYTPKQRKLYAAMDARLSPILAPLGYATFFDGTNIKICQTDNLSESRLLELFSSDDENAVYKLSWNYGDSFVTARFHSENDHIILSFDKEMDQAGYVSDGLWDISLIGSRGYGESGKGNGFKVYLTVISAMKIFIQKYEPEELKFYGFSDKQSSLYGAITKRLAVEINKLGYDLIRQDREHNRPVFKLIRR